MTVYNFSDESEDEFPSYGQDHSHSAVAVMIDRQVVDLVLVYSHPIHH